MPVVIGLAEQGFIGSAENTPRLGLLRRRSFGYEGRTAGMSGAVTRECPVGTPCQQSCHGAVREYPVACYRERRAANFILPFSPLSFPRREIYSPFPKGSTPKEGGICSLELLFPEHSRGAIRPCLKRREMSRGLGQKMQNRLPKRV